MAGIPEKNLLTSAFLQTMFDKLLSVEYIDLLHEHKLDDLLNNLMKAISDIDLIIGVAESKQFHNDAVRHWLHELKGVYYELEDLLDEIAIELSLIISKTNSQSKIRTWSFTPTTFSTGASPVTKDPKDVLDDIATEVTSWNFKAKYQSTARSRSFHPSSSTSSFQGVEGRIETKSDTVEKLQSRISKLRLEFSFLMDVSEEDGSGILPSLVERYNYLPAQLKQFFAYCSIIPADYEFDEGDLIRLWMAEGLLQETEHETIEELGHHYFVYLTSRSFFKQSRANSSQFLMLDDMVELAQFVSGNYNCTLVSHKSSTVSSETRHLSFSGGKLDAEICQTICQANRLRTLLLLRLATEDESCQLNVDLVEILSEAHPYLRALSLSRYHIMELPDSIARLRHLRYLNLSHTPIIMLPNCIDTLARLQTLDLSNCLCLTELPDSIVELRNLQYLNLSHTPITRLTNGIYAFLSLKTLDLSNCHFLTELPDFFYGFDNLQMLDLSNCYSLTVLPSFIRGIQHLSHLDISGTDIKEMPEHIGRLTGLVKLSNFVVSSNARCSGIEELGSLSNLRGSLRISQLQNVEAAEKARRAGMDEKEFDMLELEWGESIVHSEKEYEVLDHLRPHRYLKKLEIILYHGTRYPNWLGDSSFSKLVFLRLSHCNNCMQLPTLGRLPFLKDLIIEEMNAVERVGPEFYGTNEKYSSVKPFPSLETLIFQGMSEWREWLSPEVEGEEFACFQELHIRKCPKLERSLPKCLPNSTMVKVLECPALVEQAESDDEFNLQSGEQRMETVSYFQHGDPSEVPKYDEDSSEDEHDVPDSSEDESYESLKVTEISQLTKLPPRLSSLKIEGCYTLESLPEELTRKNPGLHHLYIIDCQSLISIHGDHLHTALKTIYIRNCRKFEFPINMTRKYELLKHLYIGSSCDSLKSFQLDLYPKLQSLAIWNCSNFSSIYSTKNQTSLIALEIRDCPSLVSFPERGLSTPNLKSVMLSGCKNLKELPDMKSLSSLRSLFINECPEIETIPEGGFPFSLSSLYITSCHKLKPCTEWGLRKLENLTCFEIEDGCRDLESFPEQDLLPRNLNTLRISKFSSLRILDCKGLQQLTSIEKLTINSCVELHSLSEDGLPSSLVFLNISNCPMLKSEFLEKKVEGLGCYRIARSIHIQIDGEVIF